MPTKLCSFNSSCPLPVWVEGNTFQQSLCHDGNRLQFCTDQDILTTSNTFKDKDTQDGEPWQAALAVASTGETWGGEAASTAQYSCRCSRPFTLQDRTIIPPKPGQHLAFLNVSGLWIPKCHLHFDACIHFHISHP